MDEGDQKLLDDINTCGWHVLKVFDPIGELPDFAYSVGVWHSFKQPEIIIFGLEMDDMHKIINDIVESMKGGTTIIPNQPYSDLVDGYNCIFRIVNKKHYDEHFGYAQWFYKCDDFPALQCFWPDKNGRYPWEDDFIQGLIDFQPLLFQD